MFFFLFTVLQLACLHDQNKGGFLEGQLFSSQSKPLKTFQIALIGCMDKSRSSKKATFVLIM